MSTCPFVPFMVRAGIHSLLCCFSSTPQVLHDWIGLLNNLSSKEVKAQQSLPPLQADKACRLLAESGRDASSPWVPLLHVLLAESVRPRNGSILQTCKVVAASMKPDFLNGMNSSSSQSSASENGSGQDSSTGHSSSTYVQRHAYLQQVLAALEEASLQLLLAGEQAGLDLEAEQQLGSTTGLTKKQMKQQRERENKYREERAVLQKVLSWQALASLCHLFATASYVPSDGWKAAAMRLGLGFATAAGSNSAVAVPAMLQLLLAAGVQPSQQQMAAAAKRYLAHVTVTAGGGKGGVLAGATEEHYAGAAAGVEKEERESGRAAGRAGLKAGDVGAAGSTEESKVEQGAAPARIEDVAEALAMDSVAKGGAAVEKAAVDLIAQGRALGVAGLAGQQQLADLSFVAAAAAVYCPGNEVHQQLQLMLLSEWLGKHLAGATGGEPEGIGRTEDTAESGWQSMDSREGVQWEGGGFWRVEGKGAEEGKVEEVQMMTWAALALWDAGDAAPAGAGAGAGAAAAAKAGAAGTGTGAGAAGAAAAGARAAAAGAGAAGAGTAPAWQPIDESFNNPKEQQRQQEEEEEQLRKLLRWQQEASVTVRGFLCTALERYAEGMVRATSSVRGVGHMAELVGANSTKGSGSSRLECLRVLAAAASIHSLVVNSAAAMDESSVSAAAPAAAAASNVDGGGGVGLGSSSNSRTVREGCYVLQRRLLLDLQRAIEGLWVVSWSYTPSKHGEKQQQQQEQQQEQQQTAQQRQQQQQHGQGPQHMIVSGTLQLAPLVVAAFSMLKLRPSQSWVDAIADNITNIERRRVWDQVHWGFCPIKLPSNVQGTKRVEAECYLGHVLSLLMSLATAAAPVPSGQCTGDLVFHLLLASDYPSDSAAAAAFAQQWLHGKGLMFLRMLLWVYCSEGVVQVDSMILNYRMLDKPWMEGAMHQSLAEVSDEELLGFVRAYTKAQPAAVAAAEAAAKSKEEQGLVRMQRYKLRHLEESTARALMQRLEGKMGQWTRQHQQQYQQQQQDRKNQHQQQQQQGGYKCLPFAEMLETCVAVLPHLQGYGISVWDTDIITVQQVVVQQLATASEQLPPAAAVQLWSYAVHL